MLPPFDQLVLDAALAIVAEGFRPSDPKIRERLKAGARTPSETSIYFAKKRLRAAGLLPAVGSSYPQLKSFASAPRRARPDARPAKESSRHLGPFADDIRRCRRILIWARKQKGAGS